MKEQVTALIVGLIFGFGLALSHMADPNKVLGFLDPIGHWDPSLALVMGGALLVTLPGFWLLRRWQKPLLGQTMHWPTASGIDSKLVIGSALFGIGWGIAGYCPGPALAVLTINPREAILFGLAMLVGGRLTDWLRR